MNNYGIAPELLEYLKQRQQQIEQERLAQGQRGLQDAETARSLQDIGGYANAFAQLGTLGGKSGNAQPVQQAVQSQMGLMAQQQQQDAAQQAMRDKSTGLQMKTLEFLNQGKQRQDAMAAQAKSAAASRYAAAQEKEKDRQFTKDRDTAKYEHDAEMQKGKLLTTPIADINYKNAEFGKRLEASTKILDDLAKSGYSRENAGEGIRNSLYPEAFLSNNLKSNNQAERNFVNAVLRRESGAAISESEFENAEKQYFPRAGDTPQVLAQKKQNRDQQLLGFKAAAGRAWDAVPLAPMPEVANKEQGGSILQTAKAAPAQNLPKVGEIVDGYEFLGGDPAQPESWKKP